jgi:transposase-like protein
MRKFTKLSPEVRERAVRMMLEHRTDHSSHWAAIESIDGKIGCVPQTLHTWVPSMRSTPVSLKASRPLRPSASRMLERENRELRKANEILKLASAFFAQAELDRRVKS